MKPPIRQIDKDQRSEYSKVVVMNTSPPPYAVSISSVSKNTFLLHLTGDIKNELKLTVMNMEGRVVYKGNAFAAFTLIHSNALSGSQKPVNILQLTDSKRYLFTKSFLTN